MLTRMYRRLSFIGLLSAVSLAIAGCGGESVEPSMTAADLAGRIGRGNAPVVFDVRTQQEYEAGHVPGAINIPHTDIAARAGEFSVYEDREVVVYCGTGKRAAMAEADLRAAGFKNVLDLDGHMQEWEADGYPLDQALGASHGNVEVFEQD